MAKELSETDKMKLAAKAINLACLLQIQKRINASLPKKDFTKGGIVE